MVEHPAHNGKVVGSNPIKPNLNYKMKFTFKEYKNIKTKNYIKENNLFFFFNGININCYNWTFIKQNLQKINFNSYKISNKITINNLKKSIYKNIIPTINGVTFLLKPIETTKELKKQILFHNLKELFFDPLALNLNNKIYSNNQINNLLSNNYKDNKLLYFQFKITNLKIKF